MISFKHDVHGQAESVRKHQLHCQVQAANTGLRSVALACLPLGMTVTLDTNPSLYNCDPSSSLGILSGSGQESEVLMGSSAQSQPAHSDTRGATLGQY